jgi:hypothetical protein
MTLKHTCSCGRMLLLPDSNAGQQLRCEACGMAFTAPAATAPSEASDPGAYALQDEPEPARPAIAPLEASSRQEEVKAHCARCGQANDGESYTYFVGTLAGVSAKGTSEPFRIRYTSSYRDVGEEEVFLCDDCALELWRNYFKPRLMKCLLFAGVALALFGVMLLVWALQKTTPAAVMKANNHTGIAILALLGAAGLVLTAALLAVAYHLWHSLLPLRDSNITDWLVVEWRRERNPRRSQTLFTTSEFVRRSGS